jgi:hypothetical protein
MFTLFSKLRRHLGLVIILLALIILRVPNFFEPYWYGDEAIYLTIGNALNHGERLYAEIVDHKTPLIYYLARVPDQVSFRWLLLGWMLVTTTLFYVLSWKIFKKAWLATLSTATLMIFTTLPLLEGNIPNGELFMMGFVMLGAVVFTRSSVWERFLASNQPLKAAKKSGPIILTSFSSLAWLFLAGGGFSLGILTKVPVLLDLGAFLLIFWFLAVQNLFTKAKNRWSVLRQIIGAGLIFFSGVIVPMVLSVLYFVAIGAGQAYLNFGLLYNLHYTQTWHQDFGSAWVNWALSMPGKITIMAAGLGLMTLLTKKLKPGLQLAFSWFLTATFAMLLSSRPYPHYVLQIVPAIALLVGYFFETVAEFAHTKSNWHRLSGLSLPLVPAGLIGGILIILHVSSYPLAPYYQRFWQLVTGQVSYTTYANQFDGHVADNTLAAAEILRLHPQHLFIWGTNPTLYAQTKVVPAGRFTVAFHIQDLKVYDQTLAEIQAAKPEVAVLMKDSETNFPAFNQVLAADYTPIASYSTMTLYQRITTRNK